MSKESGPVHTKRKLKWNGESDTAGFASKKDNWGKVGNLAMIKDLTDQGNKIIMIIYDAEDGASTHFLKLWFSFL